MKITILAALVAAAISMPVMADNECNRSPRTIVYADKPVDVFISDDSQRANVTFPEPYLEGISVERPEGMNFYPTPIKNRLSFMSTDPMYTGLVTIDGGTAKSYIIRLITRPGCADSEVTIQSEPLADRSQVATTNGHKKGLMNYMFDGKLPSGYRQADFSTMSKDERVVFKQGSLEFVLQSQYIGPKYIGTTYEVVNKGRTATKVAIDQIDYSNPAIRKTLGITRQVAMLPSSRILGPAPQFLTEVYADSHRGLLFIVSEKQK
ncbi:hypothetical protein GHO41_11130 [Pseudomonas sp. FSL R10-0399]|uniref:hypothetical protein n=1 Tax=Pseudomonas sp. FSL R10-0399 TaxID=2662194 RepID=UPI001296560A|nr:hypothetical protein [Pseudomonas sp. FSL R10-0399]MQT57892.1 hypothetical protein [Pseudomonas sp. FSL R10-0399]